MKNVTLLEINLLLLACMLYLACQNICILPEKWHFSHLPLSPECCYLSSRFLNCMQKVVTSASHSWDVRLKKIRTILLYCLPLDLISWKLPLTTSLRKYLLACNCFSCLSWKLFDLKWSLSLKLAYQFSCCKKSILPDS